MMFNSILNLFSSHKKSITKPGLCCVSFSEDVLSMAHVAREETNKPVLTGCGYKTVDPQMYEKTLRQWVESFHLSGATCSLMLANDDYKLHKIESLEVPHKDLSAAAKWRVKDLIDFPMERALVDVFPVPGKTHPSHHSEKKLNVVVADLEKIQPRITLLEKVGLRVNIIDIPELAFRNVNALFPEDEQGMLLIKTQEGMAKELVFTRACELYLFRLLSTGLDNNAMASNALVNEIRRSLDYTQSQLRQPAPGLLCFTGLEKDHPLLASVAQVVDMPVTVCDLNQHLTCWEPLTLEQQTHCLETIGGGLRMDGTYHVSTN